MSKPTFADIARQAKVGVATVERVLNGRGGVRPATVERVVAAARALDYPRRLPAMHRGLLRIEVIMVRPETAFYRRLGRAFERISATLDPVLRVHRSFLDEADTAAIAERIRAREPRRAGLILAVPDHPAIRAAVAEASERQSVVHVVTAVGERSDNLISIDNYAAGRSAAMYISRMQPEAGRVLAIGYPIYQVHRERLQGFSDYLVERPRAGLDFSFIGFGQDRPRIVADHLLDALAAEPGLAGLYNVGGGNSALIDVLARHPRGRRVFFVGHELTDATAAALREGVMDIVLDQAPETQARRALDLMLHRLGLTEIAPDPAPIRFVTMTSETA